MQAYARAERVRKMDATTEVETQVYLKMFIINQLISINTYINLYTKNYLIYIKKA